MTDTQNLTRPQPKAGLLDIAAYVPGKEHVEGVAKVYKLSSVRAPMPWKPIDALAKNWSFIPTGRRWLCGRRLPKRRRSI